MQGNGRDTSAATAACIDAETLAAWADGGLSKADAAAVEVHLADCERCAAMLATFARTIPETPVAESLWKQWHLRWLVPIATAATVAALWVLIPRPESPQIAAVRSEPTIEPQAPAPVQSPAASTPSESKELESRARSAPSTLADTFAKREESAPALERSADARKVNPDPTEAQPRSLNETVTVAPPPEAREADRAQAPTADAQNPRSEQFSPPVPSANPTAPAAAAPTAGISAESAARRAVAAPGRGGGTIAEIPSPDPMTRWRVIAPGQVERTTDGGARWEAARMPESATLTAGSSPSPSICWLVGRAGAIYVTTDGLRFTRVPFRDRIDFLSIQAIDGRRATVVTIDGRRMQTDDQGATWTRVAP